MLELPSVSKELPMRSAESGRFTRNAKSRDLGVLFVLPPPALVTNLTPIFLWTVGQNSLGAKCSGDPAAHEESGLEEPTFIAQRMVGDLAKGLRAFWVV
ncbi:hypothetical protein P167DRAFT_574247 [Morchella conica CCBAS932]|uniref:Uncharacterized protein n=1 Tax=Morchella conica CCBAS932 TaxID=1392247 RepID=A0A3N4L3H4_9PEZI|nr:hypothetical protein P167DRAFT_574247 [Morchella conica CCBAS932]